MLVEQKVLRTCQDVTPHPFLVTDLLEIGKKLGDFLNFIEDAEIGVGCQKTARVLLGVGSLIDVFERDVCVIGKESLGQRGFPRLARPDKTNEGIGFGRRENLLGYGAHDHAGSIGQSRQIVNPIDNLSGLLLPSAHAEDDGPDDGGGDSPAHVEAVGSISEICNCDSEEEAIEELHLSLNRIS